MIKTTMKKKTNKQHSTKGLEFSAITILLCCSFKKIFPYKEMIYSVGNGVNVFKVICVTIKMH